MSMKTKVFLPMASVDKQVFYVSPKNRTFFQTFSAVFCRVVSRRMVGFPMKIKAPSDDFLTNLSERSAHHAREPALAQSRKGSFRVRLEKVSLGTEFSFNSTYTFPRTKAAGATSRMRRIQVNNLLLTQSHENT